MSLSLSPTSPTSSTSITFDFLQRFDNLIDHRFVLATRPPDGSAILEHSRLLETAIPKHISLEQVHRSDVLKFDDYPPEELQADGLITATPGLNISIHVSDCAPVYLLDPIIPAVGLIHCGWRPIAKGIIENAISKLSDEFGSIPENIIAYIGPSIQMKDYEIGAELLEYFHNSSIRRLACKFFLDIPNEIRYRMEKLGIARDNIGRFPLSTFSEVSLCSYRRDRDDACSMTAIIGLKTIE